RLLEAREEALALLLARHVQEELADDDAVPPEVALDGVDVLEALLPHPRRHERRRKVMALEEIGMHADYEHLLVVRAVTDADAPPLLRLLERAPEELVIQLLRRRRLEGVHLAALRVHAGVDVLDRAVLAGGVHGLEDQEERPAVLRVELVLE